MPVWGWVVIAVIGVVILGVLIWIAVSLSRGPRGCPGGDPDWEDKQMEKKAKILKKKESEKLRKEAEERQKMVQKDEKNELTDVKGSTQLGGNNERPNFMMRLFNKSLNKYY